MNPVPAIKAWAGLLGMSESSPRAPLVPLDREARAELARDLEGVGLL